MDGADHVAESHKICSPEHGEDDGAEESANKAFNGLLGRELDQRSSANGLTPNVGKAIIANDERCGDPEPDEAFQDVVDDEMTANAISTGQGDGRKLHTSRTQ